DTRLTKKYYGRKIIDCLPPMKVIRTLPTLESKIMEDFLDLGMEYRDQEPAFKGYGSNSYGGKNLSNIKAVSKKKPSVSSDDEIEREPFYDDQD
ncbi:MAG: hypothetical protein JSS86_20945, partial [Cyanobacteria bacterium SZAS LIN-2]|nr:hypothetical protein [Cyanobacteria bacterium SZAS LIN-2]